MLLEQQLLDGGDFMVAPDQGAARQGEVAGWRGQATPFTTVIGWRMVCCAQFPARRVGVGDRRVARVFDSCHNRDGSAKEREMEVGGSFLRD